LHWVAVAEPLGKRAALAAPAVEVATQTLPVALELLGKDLLEATALEQVASPILPLAAEVEQQPLESAELSTVCKVLVAQAQTYFRLGQPLHQRALQVSMPAGAAAGCQARFLQQGPPVVQAVAVAGVRLEV
jgi:hypothetical protein